MNVFNITSKKSIEIKVYPSVVGGVSVVLKVNGETVGRGLVPSVTKYLRLGAAVSAIYASMSEYRFLMLLSGDDLEYELAEDHKKSLATNKKGLAAIEKLVAMKAFSESRMERVSLKIED